MTPRPQRAGAHTARALAALVALMLALPGCLATAAVDGPIVRLPAPGPPPATPGARFTVVSFNVELGDDPAALAAALRAGGLGDADVYLIQEIEDLRPAEPRARAESLAAALGTAVVYAPARRPADRGLGTHGLAILSRWPILDDVVIKLPYYELPWSPRPRIALGVVLDVAGTSVQVWNVHLDTRLAIQSRIAQLRPVFERARALPGLAIIGGDLNTLARYQEAAVDALAAEEGFATPTAELSDTVALPVPTFRLDAIYARGFVVTGAGVVREVRGSDHLPIWAQLAWPRPVTAR